MREAISSAGYFEKLEKKLNASVTASLEQHKGERNRITKRLSDIQTEIEGMWRWQKISDLEADALREVSEKLNTLAKEKKEISLYLSELESKSNLEIQVKHHADFVAKNAKKLVSGWKTSTPAMKKRLLNRLIKRIVVSNEEIGIEFWLDEFTYQNRNGKLLSSLQDNQGVLLQFPDRSQESLDQNLHINVSSIGKSGGPRRN